MGELFETTLLRLLAGVIQKFHPESRGWRMIRITPQGVSAAWVHMRPYLNDEDIPLGYRVEAAEGEPLRLCDEPSYPNLLVRCEGGEISPEVYALLGDAEQRQLFWLMVEVSASAETVSIYDKSDGSRKVLDVMLPASRTRPLSLVIEGSRSAEVTEYLPFDIHVNSETPTAAFSINIKSTSAPFRRKSFHFTLSEAEKMPLGAGTVRVDLCCRAGRPDEIILTCHEFKSPVKVREHELAPSRQRQPRFSPETIRLHLIFDRTTLDADAWPQALAALGGLVQESGDEMFAPGEISLQSWNQQLRSALADALVSEAYGLHNGEVLFQLWWFADKPRDGVAHIRNIPSLRDSFGGGEQCSVGELREQLCSSSFEYAPGFDLFDAVDEVLYRVASHIAPTARNSGKQHAVLIVGDSPPPPADKNDILWTTLVDGPPRTNARCSPRFRTALKSLLDIKVPVGWLFTKSGVPASKAGYREYENQYQYFRTLRRNVLDALHQIEGLKMEECTGGENIRVALKRLLEEMGYKDPTTPLLYFGEVSPRL